jgi:hypothetical protein
MEAVASGINNLKIRIDGVVTLRSNQTKGRWTCGNICGNVRVPSGNSVHFRFTRVT